MSSTAPKALAEPSSLRIALAQLNPIVGDLAGNEQKLLDARAKAAAEGADLIVFPELFLTGYPPEDLVLKPAFHTAARTRAEALAARLGPGPAVLVGTVWPQDGAIYNAAVLLDGGTVAAVRFKVDLPNYGVFDEKRVFMAGELPSPIGFRGVRLGVPICEDIWKEDVTECLAECGAEILLVPNGSPFDWKKPDVRMNVAVARVTETGLPLAYINQVGGQDELVFDGASFVLNGDRSLAAQLPAWEEHIALTDWTKTEAGWICTKGPLHKLTEGDAAAYQACVLGLRDYVDKNRFPGVVLGLSGGIDSALVAAMAVDALGPERVHAIMMPYRYTSNQSIADATACAEALGIRSIADLAAHAGEMSIAGDYEIFSRPEWAALTPAYGLRFHAQRQMQPDFMYAAVAAGEVDVIAGYTSDGLIAKYDLLVLDDPKHAIPPYDAMVLLAPKRENDSALRDALTPLLGKIDIATMREANLRASSNQSAADVATWLWEKINATDAAR